MKDIDHDPHPYLMGDVEFHRSARMRQVMSPEFKKIVLDRIASGDIKLEEKFPVCGNAILIENKPSGLEVTIMKDSVRLITFFYAMETMFPGDSLLFGSSDPTGDQAVRIEYDIIVHG